jgi:hypothetical protein
VRQRVFVKPKKDTSTAQKTKGNIKRAGQLMKDDDRIRFIFRKRRRFTRTTAAKALGKTIRWVEASRFSAENGGFVSWEEMVLMAYLLWTRVQIDRALGEREAAIFPRLERLVTLSVRLPEYKLIALQDEARRRRLDVSELVSDDISIFREDAERLERRAPGYMEAWHFPYTLEHAAAIRAEAEAARRAGRR